MSTTFGAQSRVYPSNRKTENNHVQTQINEDRGHETHPCTCTPACALAYLLTCTHIPVPAYPGTHTHTKPYPALHSLLCPTVGQPRGLWSQIKAIIKSILLFLFVAYIGLERLSLIMFLHSNHSLPRGVPYPLNFVFIVNKQQGNVNSVSSEGHEESLGNVTFFVVILWVFF